MDVKAVHGLIQSSDADVVIVGVFEGAQPAGAAQELDQALDGAIVDLVDTGDLSGKAGEIITLYPRGVVPARRVIVVGLGARADFGLEALRRASAHAILGARQVKARRVATALHSSDQVDDVTAAARAATEGSLLALYDYRGQKTGEEQAIFPETLELVVQTDSDVPAALRGIATGQAVASGVTLARDLVNLPPNICTPSYMADVAASVADEVGLEIEVLDQEQMTVLGMGALLAVARGSDALPRFIVMQHNAGRADELDTIVLVGKGVTFDTGGYSLKNREGMAAMKGDMAGAAAVIGTMRAVGELELPLHVVGIVPAADNMISGHAYRPQEVVTASNGVTIEIISTDAEGRMLLSDALVYAGRFEPSAVVDIATLTGTCAAALGGVAAGLFSTDDGLRDALMAAGKATSEKLWPLPLYPEYEKAIQSQTADVKNSGGRSGGIGASAMFLKRFIACPAWAHIDMAGLAFDAKDVAYVPSKGATGYGVRLLTEFVQEWTD